MECQRNPFKDEWKTSICYKWSSSDLCCEIKVKDNIAEFFVNNKNLNRKGVGVINIVILNWSFNNISGATFGLQSIIII